MDILLKGGGGKSGLKVGKIVIVAVVAAIVILGIIVFANHSPDSFIMKVIGTIAALIMLALVFYMGFSGVQIMI